jgi:hypothetical protein
MSLHLLASGCTTLALLSIAASAWAHPTESTFRVDLPQAEVHGTVLVPHIHRPVPCVVILGGSLSHDRDGRLVGEAAPPPRDALRRLAEALQAGGYGSVRFDRVGYGQSMPGATWTGSDADQAAVAAAVIERSKKSRDFTKVVVLAEHEAARIANLAAKGGALADGYVLIAPSRDLSDLAFLKSPVLTMAGRDGRTVPPNDAATIAELLKKGGHEDAVSRLMEGVDHNFQRPAAPGGQARDYGRPYEAKAYHALLEWLYKRFPTPAEGHPEEIEQIAARDTPTTGPKPGPGD